MSRPVIVLASIVAGSSALTGVLAAEPSIPRWVLIALAGLTAVGTAVGGVVTQAKTAPWSNVLAHTDADGNVKAGPAASLVAAVGDPVKVVPADDETPTFNAGTL